MTQTLLFATSEPNGTDVCARRHGGNQQSAAAFKVGDKAKDRERVFQFIHGRGEEGATLDEISEALGRPPNALSGRLTELHEAGLIKRKPACFRQTRAGARAAVWVTG